MLNTCANPQNALAKTSRPDYAESFNQALTKGLVDFLKTSGMKKKDFAILYECGVTYVPRLLSGQKAVDIAKFMRIALNAGYTPTLVFDPPKWEFEKTSPFAISTDDAL